MLGLLAGMMVPRDGIVVPMHGKTAVLAGIWGPRDGMTVVSAGIWGPTPGTDIPAKVPRGEKRN